MDVLRAIGETGSLSMLAAMRSEVLYRIGRRDEMEAGIQLARGTGASDDIATQAQWRWVAAMAAADDGRRAEARQLVTEAIELVEPTDELELRSRVYEAQAHVAARAGRPDEWTRAIAHSLAEREAKGDIV